MKTIGLIGGMSWESSLEYYRLINEAVKARLGGFHSARCLMYSVDFAEIEDMQRRAAWDESAVVLGAAARSVERGGADCVVLCTNTMHKVAGKIQAQIRIPLLHIVDATAEAIRARSFQRVGLLGTRFTMEEDFYKGRLSELHGLEVVIPEVDERAVVHQVVDEICLGERRPESRARYLEIIEHLAAAGAQGVILGCTEIGLLVHQEDSRVPLFDTTQIHAAAAVEFALREPDPPQPG